MSVSFSIFKSKPAILTWLLFMLCPLVLNAQLRVGPKLGFQISRSVYADEDYRQEFSSSFRPGMQMGGIVNYRVNSVYSLHTELYFCRKGKSSKSRNAAFDPVKNTAHYNYLDLPVLLRLSKHKKMKKTNLEYYLNAGPNINYWFGGRGTLHSGELYEYTDSYSLRYKIRFREDFEPDEVYIENARRLQMSLDFGGGVLFDLGLGRAIMVDLRNSIGIGKTYMGERNSADYGLYYYNDNFEAVNHVFSLSVAYLIDIDMMALLQKGRVRR